jgi:hypothetical protein
VPPWRMLRRFCSREASRISNIPFSVFSEGRFHAYGVLFLDVELEVNRAGAGGCYAELYGD